MHDVWLLPSTTCDFSPSGGGQVVSSLNSGKYVATLAKPGSTYYYACSVSGHCDSGQFLKVTVEADAPTAPTSSPSSSPSLARLAPPAPNTSTRDPAVTSNGTCLPPVVINATTNEVMVECYSPSVDLAPGDNIYPNILLVNPYPDPSVTPEVILTSISTDLVDSNNASVPLSEVYLHHVFGDVRFVSAEGAEFRHSPVRTPLPEPWTTIVNTSLTAIDDSRYVNFHVIRTTGVDPQNDLKDCLECKCNDGSDPPTGSVRCCYKCPTNSTAPSQSYRLQINTTYIIPPPNDTTIIEQARQYAVTPVVLDVHGGLEYSTQATGDGSLSAFSRSYKLDFFCPQTQNFTVLRCWAHQHIGAVGVTIVDKATNDTICSSEPLYGNGSLTDVGNEEGYLVGMGDTAHVDAPYVIQPGQEVVLTATYKGDRPYLGVMSLFAVQFGGFDARSDCDIDFAGFIQPPLTVEEANNGTGTAGGHNATTIQTDLENLFDAVPATCTSYKSYLDGALAPCVQYIAESAAENGSALKVSSTCCASLATSQEQIKPVFGDVLNPNSNVDCLCKLGDVLAYFVANNVYQGIQEVVQGCKFGNGDPAQSNSITQILNGYFAPKCPKIAQELGLPTANATDTASSPPQPPVDVATTSPSLSPSPPPISGAHSYVFHSIPQLFAFFSCIFLFVFL